MRKTQSGYVFVILPLRDPLRHEVHLKMKYFQYISLRRIKDTKNRTDLFFYEYYTDFLCD